MSSKKQGENPSDERQERFTKRQQREAEIAEMQRHTATLMAEGTLPSTSGTQAAPISNTVDPMAQMMKQMMDMQKLQMEMQNKQITAILQAQQKEAAQAAKRQEDAAAQARKDAEAAARRQEDAAAQARKDAEAAAKRQEDAAAQARKDAADAAEAAAKRQADAFEAATARQQEQNQRAREQQQELMETLTQRIVNLAVGNGGQGPPGGNQGNGGGQGNANAGQGNRGAGPHPTAKKMDIPKLGSPEEMKLIDFRDWKIRFEDYSAATRLAQECDLNARRGILRSALDQEWTKMWTQQVIPVAPEDDTPQIIDRLEQYLRRHRHPLVDRREFIQRDQQMGEKVDNYYAALRAIDQDCGYDHAECGHGPQHREERLRDRLISGLIDSALRQKVLETPLENLTLQNVLETCRNYESSRDTDDKLAKKGDKMVNAFGGKKSNYQKQKQAFHDKSKEDKEQKDHKATDSKSGCDKCGFPYHKYGKCPAEKAKCKKCNKIGHYAHRCKSDEKKENVQNITSFRISSGDEEMTYPVDTQHGNHRITDFQWIPDTGAEANVMDLESFKELKGKNKVELEKSTVKLRGASLEDIPSLGTTEMTLRRGDLEYRARVHILKEANAPLLSFQGCKALGFLPKNWPNNDVIQDAPSKPKAESSLRLNRITVSPVRKLGSCSWFRPRYGCAAVGSDCSDWRDHARLWRERGPLTTTSPRREVRGRSEAYKQPWRPRKHQDDRDDRERRREKCHHESY